MKAQELRMRNLVQTISDEPEIITIDGIDGIENMVMGNGEVGWEIDDLEPIPLTEEWLLKFGFEWKGADHYENGEYWIEDYRGGFRFCRPHFCHVICTNVHQIQNLFFALTGEELEIK